MAEQYSLEVQPRTVIGKHVKYLRRENLVPGIIYGVGGDPVNVSCPYRALEIVLQKAGGTHLVNVTVEGSTHNALVRAVQRDKIKRTILHVDFLRVDLSRKRRTSVPLVFINAPKLASDLQLTHNLQSVEVESLPTDIPDHINVDLSRLAALGDQMTAADLTVAQGVEIVSDPHEVLARIEAMAAAEPEEELAVEETATATSEPEVIEKGKKEEEEF